MQLVAPQKAAAQAIVNIFETGSVAGKYGDVTLMRGDTGQLTYGRSQTTLASGNLYLLIKDYADRTDGALCEDFKPYLPQLEACSAALNSDMKFRQLLRDAGDDPVMQEVQDAFFDRIYWDPAVRSADAIGVATALGAAIVYDSTVHGSWARIRDLTRQRHGELHAIGEETWMGHYVDERRNWLATNPNALLQKTVYRMDAFETVISNKNWTLALPLMVRGLSITPECLDCSAPVKVQAEEAPRRLLCLKSPALTGADVGWLQERLQRAGLKVECTGNFDAPTDAAVKAFQTSKGFKPDGLVGPVTRAALEDLSLTVPATANALDEPMPAVATACPTPSVAVAAEVVAPVAQAPAPAAVMSVTAITPAPPGAAAIAMPVVTPEFIAEIKQHFTSEMQASLKDICATIESGHQELAATVATSLVRGDTQGAVTVVKASLVNDSEVLLSHAVDGRRPITAAAVSVGTLAVTQVHDALIQRNNVPGASSPNASQVITRFLDEGARTQHFLAATFQSMHTFAASLPAPWVFGLRVGALVLMVYALYHLIMHHRRAKNHTKIELTKVTQSPGVTLRG